MDDTDFAEDATNSAAQNDVSVVGIALALAGMAAMLIAVFLPIWDASSVNFALIKANTLIQEGSGWFYVTFVASAAISIFRAYRVEKPEWWPMIAGALALAYTIYIGTDKNTMTLCPLNRAFDSGCQRASPGVGIYVAGVGAFLTIVGGWQIRASKVEANYYRGAPAATADRSKRKACPDCAETILAEARVCKYCGYRFRASP